MNSSSPHPGMAFLTPRTGRDVNSSGWNPENSPTTCYDPERVAPGLPTGFDPFGVSFTRACGFRGPVPTAIHVQSLRDWSDVTGRFRHAVPETP